MGKVVWSSGSARHEAPNGVAAGAQKEIIKNTRSSPRKKTRTTSQEPEDASEQPEATETSMKETSTPTEPLAALAENTSIRDILGNMISHNTLQDTGIQYVGSASPGANPDAVKEQSPTG